MAKKYERNIIIGVSDKHGGHKLGLCNPETIFRDEDEEGNIIEWHPQLNPVQDYLWELYNKNIDDVKHLAGKDDVVILDLGDPTQGGKYMSEVMTTRPADQFSIAVANMEPLYRKLPTLKAVRLAKGTGSHEFEQGTSTLTVEQVLRYAHPKINTQAIYHGLANIRGVKVDYAHHGPYPGSRNWLQGNVARYDLKSMVEDCINFGIEPPDLVMRGHYHIYIKEFLHKRHAGNEYNIWLTVNPSYAFPDDWTRKQTRSVFLTTNGLLAYEIINGKIYDIHAFIKTKDRRTKEDILK